MKRKHLLAALCVPALCCLTSCFTERALLVTPTQNNPDYTVSYLFEHDGCRVYRFYDPWSGSYVYFNTQGDATAIPNDSTRRQTITYRHRGDRVYLKPATPQP